MLQQLTIKNFKLFDEQGVTLAPGKITVLIGANGTGKSSVLQMLLLLKQSTGHESLNTSGPLVDLGTYQDVVHGRDTSRAVEVELSASYHGFDVKENIEPSIADSGTFEYRAVLAPELLGYSGSIGDGDGRRLVVHRLGGRSITDRVIVRVDGGVLVLQTASSLGLPFRIADSSLPDSIMVGNFQPKFNVLLTTLQRLLNCYFLLPAIRGFDRHSYDVSPTEELPDDLTAAGDPDEQAALATRLMAQRPELADEAAERLARILGRDTRLRSRLSGTRLSGETAGVSGSVNLLHEAFGLNQLVAPLLWLGKVPRGAVIGIEEPEIHLHPRAQGALCNVFVEVATDERKQLMLTTHSEHILMGLLTAVADGRLQPDDLAVYEFRREGSVARAKRLEVNGHGQVQGGLRGFLEVDMEEIGNLIQARFRK